jgi:hypothetical protein
MRLVAGLFVLKYMHSLSDEVLYPDVHLPLQEVGRKAMPQRVETDALVYAGGLLGA